MRKRIVIGVIVAVVMGVAVYVFTEPRKGSVEWHKREYIKARDWVDKPRFVEWVKATFCKMTGTPYRTSARTDFDTVYKQRLASWHALRRLGYLREEMFFLEHQPKSRVVMLINRVGRKELP